MFDCLEFEFCYWSLILRARHRAFSTLKQARLKKPSPRIAALTAVVIWGVSFVASKTALRDISPATLLFTRFGIGTLVLTVMVHWRGSPVLPPRDTWQTLAWMGFVGIFAHHMLQATGLTLTTAVHTGWLIGVIPIWSAVLSAVLLKERFGGMKVAGLIGGFAGAVLVVTKGNFGSDLLLLGATRGDFLILLSTVTWAVYSVLGHDVLKRLGPTRATAGAMLFGWLMLTPLFLWQEGWREWSHLRLMGWVAMLFLGVGCSAVGYLFWYGALEGIEVSRVAAFLYIEPLVTLVAAVVLLNEPVDATTIIGGVVVLVSVFVIQHAPS
jgi:drug/metabolite transporter (DMT)-like permease